MTISNDFVTLNANDSKMVHNAEKLRLDLSSPSSVDVFLKKKLKLDQNWPSYEVFLKPGSFKWPLGVGDF